MRAPVLAVGDGALGFWKALRDVWPETREQRCWVHRIANVLDKLPKRLHAKAKAALHEIMRVGPSGSLRGALPCRFLLLHAPSTLSRSRYEHGVPFRNQQVSGSSPLVGSNNGGDLHRSQFQFHPIGCEMGASRSAKGIQTQEGGRPAK